jgi:hypothetical protein
MGAYIATDELIEALNAMEQAMVEFEAERDHFERRTGKPPETGLIEEALSVVEFAISQQNMALAETLEIEEATKAAVKSAWLAEAALRRAASWLAAYRAE